MVRVRSRESSTTQIDSENSLSPLGHFTERLVDVFGKLPPENSLDHKFSRLLIRQLKSNYRLHLQQSTHKPTTTTAALTEFLASFAHYQIEPWLELTKPRAYTS
jgi:hypothetical protein